MAISWTSLKKLRPRPDWITVQPSFDCILFQIFHSLISTHFKQINLRFGHVVSLIRVSVLVHLGMNEPWRSVVLWPLPLHLCTDPFNGRFVAKMLIDWFKKCVKVDQTVRNLVWNVAQSVTNLLLLIVGWWLQDLVWLCLRIGLPHHIFIPVPMKPNHYTLIICKTSGFHTEGGALGPPPPPQNFRLNYCVSIYLVACNQYYRY